MCGRRALRFCISVHPVLAEGRREVSSLLFGHSRRFCPDADYTVCLLGSHCSSVTTRFHVPHRLSLLRALEIGPMGAAASSVLEVRSRGDPDSAVEKEWTILNQAGSYVKELSKVIKQNKSCSSSE